MIKDSGNRKEFASGAVRDIQEGKGRCDLLPMAEVAVVLNNAVFCYIRDFQRTGDTVHLFDALDVCELYPDWYTMILEVAIHFEEGCQKYGERNWEKGIPAERYIDSAIRHYLKHLRGDRDEPHDRAFVWNILCCAWTCANKPELNSYKKDGGGR